MFWAEKIPHKVFKDLETGKEAEVVLIAGMTPSPPLSPLSPLSSSLLLSPPLSSSLLPSPPVASPAGWGDS